MTRVVLEGITMVGNEYVLFARDGQPPAFPHGELQDGESPADGMRRLVQEWTETEDPKLEVVDFRSKEGELGIVFRALLTSDPKGGERKSRMSLPESVGPLQGPWIEDALKTSLNYKLTRR